MKLSTRRFGGGRKRPTADMPAVQTADASGPWEMFLSSYRAYMDVPGELQAPGEICKLVKRQYGLKAERTIEQ